MLVGLEIQNFKLDHLTLFSHQTPMRPPNFFKCIFHYLCYFLLLQMKQRRQNRKEKHASL